MELKPCPFCGHDKPFIERYGNPRVSTQYECGMCSCHLETGEEWDHGRRWNSRPLEEKLEAEVSRLTQERDHARLLHVAAREYIRTAIYELNEHNSEYRHFTPESFLNDGRELMGKLTRTQSTPVAEEGMCRSFLCDRTAKNGSSNCDVCAARTQKQSEEKPCGKD